MTNAQMLSPRARAVEALRHFVMNSGLREGERLPAENKLALQFEVSRMTLRSAMEVLEREGMVRRSAIKVASARLRGPPGEV